MNRFSAGKAIGVLSGVSVLGFLTMLLISPPYAPIPGNSTLVLVSSATLALLVVAASLVGSPGAILIAFVLSFLPVGLYLLLSPGLFKWIGIAELGYLLAAALLYYGNGSRH